MDDQQQRSATLRWLLLRPRLRACPRRRRRRSQGADRPPRLASGELPAFAPRGYSCRIRPETRKAPRTRGPLAWPPDGGTLRVGQHVLAGDEDEHIAPKRSPIRARLAPSEVPGNRSIGSRTGGRKYRPTGDDRQLFGKLGAAVDCSLPPSGRQDNGLSGQLEAGAHRHRAPKAAAGVPVLDAQWHCEWAMNAA